jgi:L-iditol 2-dehydrogenase
MPIVRDDVPEPACGDGEILLKVRMASICNLTDTHTIEGLHPPHDVWADGHFVTPPGAFPAPIGHEGAGEVVEVGAGVTGVSVGARVCTVRASAMFADYAVVRPRDITPLPDHVSWEEGAPSELLACSWPLVEQTVRVGDRVVVLGQGASGLLVTQCARLAGARQLITVEPLASKRDLSIRLGADATIDPAAVDVVEAVQELTDGRGADAVIECVGIPETIAMTTRLIRKGRGVPGDQGANIGIFGACRHPVPFDFMELHWKAARVFTAGSSTHGYTKFGHERAVDLIASGQVQMKPLLTHKFPLERTAEAFEMIMQGSDECVKVLVDPGLSAPADYAGPAQFRLP